MKFFVVFKIFMVSIIASMCHQIAWAAPLRLDLSDLISVTSAKSSTTPLTTLNDFATKQVSWLSPAQTQKSVKWNGRDEYWYRLNLSQLSLSEYNTPVVVLPFVIQALSIYSEGQQIYSWGSFNPNGSIGFRGYPIHIVPLKDLNLKSPLFIRVGSGGANIGIIDAAYLAERSTAVESYFWLGLPNLALFVLAFLLSCLAFSAFIVTRKNRTLLAYSLFALCIGTFVGSHSYTLRLSTDWAKIRHSIELMSLYLTALTFSYYLDTIFAQIDKFRILNKSWKFYAIFALCAFIGELTQWAPLFHWLRPWQMVTAAIFLTVPYFTIKSMLSRSIESYFVGGGLISFTVASFAGVIFSASGGAVTAPIFHIFIISGVFFLLSGLGGLLVYKHYDTNRKVILYQREASAVREAQARQEKDMEAARAVQQTLLPLSINFPGFETAAHWTTADQTGGDWYTGHYDGNSKTAYVFMGDVTGHGFASALVTGLAHGAVTSVFKLFQDEARLDPEQMLVRIANAVNVVVHECASRSVRAMSMVCLALNSETGEIHLLNCGHPQVYLIKKSKKMEVLLGAGSLLGFQDSPFFDVKNYQMDLGDRIFIYTDGIFENGRSHGKALSFSKLRRALSQRDKPVAETQSDLLNLLRDTWQATPIEDDYTMILMQWGEEAAPA